MYYISHFSVKIQQASNAMRRGPARSRCWRRLTSWCWGWSLVSPPSVLATVLLSLRLTSVDWDCGSQGTPHQSSGLYRPECTHTGHSLRFQEDTTITQSCFQLEGQSQWSEQNFQDQSGQQETKLDEGSVGTYKLSI